jgi:hypothetical protein
MNGSKGSAGAGAGAGLGVGAVSPFLFWLSEEAALARGHVHLPGTVGLGRQHATSLAPELVYSRDMGRGNSREGGGGRAGEATCAAADSGHPRSLRVARVRSVRGGGRGVSD